MAAAEKRSSASGTAKLQCAICLDELHVPKALPCLHTFCLACLQRHVAATVRTKGDKIVCPECRRKCWPSNPKRPVCEWASQFPTNFHLQNSVGTSKSCSGGGVDDQAQNAGDDFTRRLKESRAFVDNRLLELGAEQHKVCGVRSRLTLTWNQSKEHLHEVFAKLTSAVQAREEELAQKLDEEYVENTQRLFAREDRIAVRMKQLRHCSDLITSVMTGEGEDVSQDLANIEKRLNQASRGMADESKVTEEEPCTSVAVSPGDVAKVLSAISELGASGRTEPAGCLAEAAPPSLPQTPPGLSSSQRPASPLNAGPLPHEEHRPLTALAERERLAGPAASPEHGATSSLAATSELKYVTIYNLTSRGDKKEPFVTGVCCVAGILLLTDVNNRSVKGLYFHPDGHRTVRTDDLFLRSDPLCVAALRTAERAVVGSERCLYVLRVVRDRAKVVVQDVVQTAKCYYGIAALPAVDGRSVVAACGDQPPGVDLLDLHGGRVIRTISQDPATGGPLFVSPFYLTALPRGWLVVSDKDNAVHPLTCVSTEGDVIYRYAASPPVRREGGGPHPLKLTWPLGVSSCGSGQVLVVDATQHAVFRVSPAGEVVGKVLEDASRLRSPSALCVDDASDNLFVVGHKGQVLLVCQ